MSEMSFVPLGAVATARGGTGFPEHLQGGAIGLPFIKVSDMNLPGNERFIHSANNYVSAEIAQNLGAKIFNKGDIVFAKVGAALLLNRRRVLTGPTLIDNNLMAVTPNSVDGEFLRQLLLAFDMADLVQVGALPSVNQRQVHSIPVPDFSPADQCRIAEVLSALDEQIDAVGSEIMKQKSVLDGLLDRLLLDGLRDCKLGDYVEISPNINTQMPSQMTPFIPMESVSEDGHIYDWSFRPWSEVSSGFTRFSSGDVLVAKITPCFENGKGAQVPIGIPVGAGSTEFHVLRAKQGVCPRWIYWHTRVREFRIAGAGRMTGSAGQQRVPRDFIESFAVKSVSEKEQIEITACLDSVDVVIQLLIKEQEKLRLQKQGLMRDLLTGAVRVTVGN